MFLWWLYLSFHRHPTSLPFLRLACDATESSEWDSTRLTSAAPFSLATTALDTVPWRLDLGACQSSDTSTLLHISLDALTRLPRLFWSPCLPLFFLLFFFLIRWNSKWSWKLGWQVCLRETYHTNIVELKKFSLVWHVFCGKHAVQSICGGLRLCLNQYTAFIWRSLLQAMWTFT